MSDVIRDALVRIRFEVQKSKLEGPELSQTVKAHKEVAAAQRDVAQASREYGDSFNRVDWSRYEQQQAGIVRQTNAVSAAHEEFGERSSRSYIRSIGGVTQLSRGLALLAANGSEDSQKLLRSIVGIQGGIDVVRGSLQLMRLGPEFGAIAAGVTAGAGAWMLYSQQVEKARKEVDSLTESHHKASQAESKMMQDLEAIRFRGQSARVDANYDPATRRAEQAKQLEDIRQKRAEAETEFNTNNDARKAAQQHAEKARSAASTFAESTFQGLMQGKSPVRAYTEAEARDRITKYADRQGESAKEYGSRAEASIQRQLEGAERERELLQRQHDDQVVDIRKRETDDIARMRKADENASPIDQYRRKMDDMLYEQRRQDFNAANAGPGFSMGFGILGPMANTAMHAVGNATPQDLREAGTHFGANQAADRVNASSTRALQQVESTMDTLRVLMTNVDRELKNLHIAHPN